MPKPRKASGSKQVEKKLFILVEGMIDKSESAYFKSFIKNCKFAGDKVNVKVIDTKKNTGKELVKEAKKSREIDRDIVWIVYDKDGYTKHPETFDLAKKNNIKIGFSSISFEYWILLHFSYSSKAYLKSDDIIKELKKNNYLDYTKGDRSIFLQTKHLLHIAQNNATKIQLQQLKNNPEGTPVYNFNPYTNLNELIDDIKSFES